MDKPFSQHRPMLASIMGTALRWKETGQTRRKSLTGPLCARREMFPSQRVRDAIYADLGAIMAWLK